MKIVWTSRAIRHLVALRDSIAEDSPKAAASVASKILGCVEPLSNQPQIGRPGRILGTKELVVTGGVYVIPYRVVGARLELLAVFHGSQKWPAHI